MCSQTRYECVHKRVTSMFTNELRVSSQTSYQYVHERVTSVFTNELRVCSQRAVQWNGAARFLVAFTYNETAVSPPPPPPRTHTPPSSPCPTRPHLPSHQHRFLATLYHIVVQCTLVITLSFNSLNCFALILLELSHWFLPLLSFSATAVLHPFPLSPFFVRH